MLIVVFVLLIVFQAKHYVADYLLQNKYMLGKFNPGWDFFWPLASHAAVHTAFTFVLCGGILGFWPGMALGLFDGITHFVIDRLKAGPKYLGRYKPTDKQFWWALGADQLAHHLVHYVIIGVMMAVLFG